MFFGNIGCLRLKILKQITNFKVGKIRDVFKINCILISYNQYKLLDIRKKHQRNYHTIDNKIK